MSKSIMEYSRKEFKKMTPYIPDNLEFNGIIIVPMKEIHDSGFGCMKFILLEDTEIVGVCGGFNDAIHLNGFGGYGLDYDKENDPQTVHRVDWSIDILPKSKCVRLFCSNRLQLPDAVFEAFSVYSKPMR